MVSTIFPHFFSNGFCAPPLLSHPPILRCCRAKVQAPAPDLHSVFSMPLAGLRILRSANFSKLLRGSGRWLRYDTFDEPSRSTPIVLTATFFSIFQTERGEPLYRPDAMAWHHRLPGAARSAGSDVDQRDRFQHHEWRSHHHLEYGSTFRFSSGVRTHRRLWELLRASFKQGDIALRGGERIDAGNYLSLPGTVE